MRLVRGLLLSAVLGFVCAAFLPAAANAGGKTVWLCKPGQADNPCAVGLKTTIATPTGEPIRVEQVKRDRHRKIDCFYVYPTVSDDATANSDRSVDPEERSIALYQAARYSQHCRVFAPMYRQITLAQLLSGKPITEQMRKLAFSDVARAWKTYLKKYNRGRGVVLIGHSQGAGMLRQLISKRIDKRPNVRKRLVSAIVLGGDVLVANTKGGKGGDFRNVKPCRSRGQLGCVIAFSTFDGPVPDDSLFGRASNEFFGGGPAAVKVLCTNPASLRGGEHKVVSIYPTEPFAPGTTLGLVTPLVGNPQVDVGTPWIEYRGAYKAGCSSADNANVLQVTALPGSPVLHATPDPTWGLHLIDANIALGNLVGVVARQSHKYVKLQAKKKAGKHRKGASER